MKKIKFLAFVLLSGCAVTESIFAPPKMINNPKCEEIHSVKLFQVLDRFALAQTCSISEISDDLICYGLTVYVPKEKNKLYYDNLLIEPEKDMCISYSGTYSYESNDGAIRTVPKLKFVKKKIENPAYKKFLEEKSKKEKNSAR